MIESKLIFFWLTILVIFATRFDRCSAANIINKYFERKLNCWQQGLQRNTFPVKFFFSSRNQTDYSYTLDQPFESEAIDFDPTRPTAVLVHGFLGTVIGNPLNLLRNKLLELVIIFSSINMYS